MRATVLHTVSDTDPAPPPSLPLLRVGSSGAFVIEIQGYVGAVQDGKFGPQTCAAVKHWQAGHGLVADGIVGPKTWASFHATP
jgi:peptidoglycan hydrolase-like protein with peptidoglycan-binding domain